MASIHPDTPRARGDPDAPHVSPVTPDEDMRTILINRVSWGAVFAGVVIALVTQLILNLIGIGIGAATFDPASGANPSVTAFSVGAGIWWTISGILAALAGGYAAGRLAGQPKQDSGGWHGLTAWALATLVIFALLTTTAGAIAGGALRFLGSVAGGTAQTLGVTAQTAVQSCSASDHAGSRSSREYRKINPGGQRRQRSGSAQGRGNLCSAGGRDCRPRSSRGRARTRRSSSREGPGRAHRRCAWSHRTLRAAIPPGHRPSEATGDRGRTSGDHRRLARRAFRLHRAAPRRNRRVVGRPQGCSGPDHHDRRDDGDAAPSLALTRRGAADNAGLRFVAGQPSMCAAGWIRTSRGAQPSTMRHNTRAPANGGTIAGAGGFSSSLHCRAQRLRSCPR